jgi:hypothetical protein
LRAAVRRSIVEGGAASWTVEVVGMQAKVGDRLVIESRTTESARREGEILEVRGTNGAPPYVVRWSDGHEGLTYPGPDAHVVAG